MKVIDFNKRKKAHDHELSQARYENRFAFNCELPSLISSNPGEFALYERGIRVGLYENRSLANEKAVGPEFTVFEIPSR